MSADLAAKTPAALGGRILKVNHAGEHGAVQIYAGQIRVARLTCPSLVAELQDFKVHEERHRGIFLAELQRRGVRRCRSYAFCAIGGYVLGMVTALMGRQAIVATTVAVERVVLAHLEQQLATLAGQDEAAVAAIQQIVDDERHHHDRSAALLNPGRLWPRLITPVVSASTELVIWAGMHL